MNSEIWAETVGGYMVSNYGRVKKPRAYDRSGHLRDELILKDYTTPWGYKRINLYIDGKRKNLFVHRLVAGAFVSGEKPGLFVNHIDGDKTNNFYKNLEWVTSSENQLHAFKTGLKKPSINGEKISKRIKQYTMDGVLIKIYPSSKEVQRQTGFLRSNICTVCRKKSGSAYGFKWEYDLDTGQQRFVEI